MRVVLLILFLAVSGGTLCVRTQNLERVNVRIVADQAEAVLRILEKRSRGQEVATDDWKDLFATEGYVRLKKRELSLSRPFADDDFRAFVLSDALAARWPELTATLTRWRTVSKDSAAKRALGYLPEGAFIRAKIYPVFKPRDNSFVFELKTDPAIFLYLDPSVDSAKFENTLAHELHHIGFGTACPSAEAKSRRDRYWANAKKVIEWSGAFGEGLAMLAAAGGPDVHPHAVSQADERGQWDRDMANFNQDLKRVETFFIQLANGELAGDEENNAGRGFFGVQGPWYTVGWKMAVVIEKALGRDKVVGTFCDGRDLLKTYNRAAKKYNRAAGEPLAVWSEELLKKLN
jgi:hypothetical protein